MSQKRFSLLQDAFLLTAATLIVKILSTFYRIPFQNMVGDHGLYVYQQAYPFYALAMTLATYGFPVMISRLVAERSVTGTAKELEWFMNQSLRAMVYVSFLIGIVIFTGGPYFARWMGDASLVMPIQISALCYVFLPWVALSRGYFQGNNNMTPTAISQVVEQVVRVSFILVFTYVLFQRGASIYVIGSAATAGGVLSFVASSVVLALFFRKQKKRPFRIIRVKISMDIIKPFLVGSFAICISSLLYIFFQFVDAFTFVSLLQKEGVPLWKAQQLKGVYDRAQPFIQLGTVVSTAVSLAVVPLVTMLYTQRNMDELKGHAAYALKMSMFTSIAASVGLGCIIQPTNTMLYENAKGSFVLAILGISIIGNSIALTTAALLQGLGALQKPLQYAFIGVGAKILFNVLLIPIFHSVGAALATVCAFFITALLQWRALSRQLQCSLITFSYIQKLLRAAFVMAIALIVYTFLFEQIVRLSRLTASIEALTAVGIGAIFYIYIAMRQGALEANEWTLLPKGDKISRLINKFQKRR